ncbi:hypothetical protein [Vagococcus salmoninarum]|uniref:hypothetical protein n=1 Tax=Vagococcus salmoninarum TaxID=2739 RepID=UPI00187FE162|nr:hypothetical protein [Vagococcus salmoninarum]MBE9388605.1 hypothetical protein [Vagococcus salmoninarum]
MKRSMKVILGIGTATIIGSAVALTVSDKLIETIKQAKNRQTVKQFVNEKFDGSEKLLNIVDDLSDSEVQSVVSILRKVKEGRKKISVTSNPVREGTEEVKRMLANFVESFA